MVEFPENPRNAFDFESVPKAKGVPPRLKLAAALTAPSTSRVAAGEVVPMPTPTELWKILEFPNLVALNHNGT
jgi:hypothetical protein